MQQKSLLERASWIAGIVSAILAAYLWLAPQKNPGETQPEAKAQQQSPPVRAQPAPMQTLPVSPPRTADATPTQGEATSGVGAATVCPTTESIQLALKQASALSTYSSRDEAYSVLVGDALCLGNLELVYSIAANISSYDGRDKEYTRVFAVAISQGKLDLAEKVAGNFRSYAKRDSARKQILDAIRKRS